MFKLTADRQPATPTSDTVRRDAIDRAKATAERAQGALNRALSSVARAEANAIRSAAEEETHS